jgi:hypothetical protein
LCRRDETTRKKAFQKQMFPEHSRPESNQFLRRQVQPTAPLRTLLTLEQVAEMLGVSKAWVRDHATRRSPRIPVVRFGDRRGVLRFRPEDVERFINSNLLSTEENT